MPKKNIVLTNKDFIQAGPCVFVYPKELTHHGNVRVNVKHERSKYKGVEIIFPYNLNIKGDLDVSTASHIFFTDIDECNISGNLISNNTCTFWCHNTTHIWWNLIAHIINLPDMSHLDVAGDIIWVQWIRWDSLNCKGNMYSNQPDSDGVDIDLSCLRVAGIIDQATDIVVTMWMDVGEIQWYHSITARNIIVWKVDSKWFAPCDPHQIIATWSIDLPWVDKHTEIFTITPYKPISS